MTSLVVSLLGGVAAIVAGFAALQRFTPLRGREAAVVVAALVLLVYGGTAALAWPGADVFAIHLAVYLVGVYVLGIVWGGRDAAREAGARRRFHWAPAAIVVFFAAVVAADALFIMIAEKGVGSEVARWLLPETRGTAAVHSVFPGTVARDYQKNEAGYNAYLEQVQRQRARGWEVRKGFLAPARAGEPVVFQVQVRDRDGVPVTGAEVEGAFLRPANSRRDQPFRMREVDLGLYRVDVVLPEPGTWNLTLQVRRDGERHEVQGRTSIGPAVASR